MYISTCVAVLLLPLAMGVYRLNEEPGLELYARESFLEKGCGGKNADIAFVIDNSASIWQPDYIKQIEFIKSVVKIFRIGPKQVRIGAVTFGDGVYRQLGFGFNQYNDESSVLNGISKIRYMAGRRTKTDEALDYTRRNLFSESLANPDRQRAVRIGIVLTDGESLHKDKTAIAAKRLKKSSKALVFAIGVGKKVSQTELEAIATSKDYVFRVENYDALSTIRKELGVKICEVPTTPAPTPPKEQPCGIKDPADIILVYDSTEVGPSGISDIRRGVAAFLRTDAMQHPGMQVGLIAGECPEVRSFPLNKYKNKSKIPRLFDRLAYSELDALVGELRTDAFHPEHGARKNARRIGILIVTGKPANSQAVRVQAEMAKLEGIELYVVGSGNVVDEGFLRTLTSRPVDQHLILGSDYRNFDLVGRELAEKICKNQ